MFHDQDEAPRREPIFKLPPAILWLLGLMLAVQLVIAFSDLETQLWIFTTLGLVPARYATEPQSIWQVLSLAWPFVTHGFVHGNWAHIFFNGLWLMAVGTPLVRRLGSPSFLPFYFACGALAAATHLVLNINGPFATDPVVGASGAISGCMAGALRVMLSGSARYFLSKHPGIGRLAPLWDRRIVLITLVWVGINALAGTPYLKLPGTGGAAIAWEAHVGGFLAGLILIPIFDRLGRGSTRAYPDF